MSLMKLIRVANMQLAAYSVISADGMSMKITRKLFKAERPVEPGHQFAGPFAVDSYDHAVGTHAKSLMAFPLSEIPDWDPSNGTSIPRAASSRSDRL